MGLLASESGVYTPGVTYTCNLGDNVSLILGTNLGNTVAWSSDGSNHKDNDESQQAVTAVGITFDASGANFISGIPTWLNSYTDENITAGYWTLTPEESYSYRAWYVDVDGDLGYHNVNYDSFYGIRPVITISKSKLD